MVDLGGRHAVATMPNGFDDLSFAQMLGRDSLSDSFEFSLRVVGTDLEKDPNDILGKAVGVELRGTEFSRYFHGIVSAFGLSNLEDGLAHYEMTLRPWLWFLSIRRDCRIFQNLSVVDIIEEVFSAYPMADYELRLQGSYAPREYCVQYDESDLTLVERLMEHEGIFYYFEFEDGLHRLVLVDDNTSLEAVPGFEEVPFRTHLVPGSEERDYISEWTSQAQVRSGAYAHTDYDFTRPKADLMSVAQNGVGHELDDAEVYAHPGAHLDLDRGDTVALLRLQELQSARVLSNARGTVRGLWSGATFKLMDFEREAENVEHVVLSASYALFDEQYAAGMSSVDSDGFEIEISVMPVSLPYRPPRRAQVPIMRGPQTATVVGPAGEEIFTDEFARVKVQFHWDRLGGRNEDSSCFVRVSSAWAGSGWGFIQIPRIGQEVIVDFIEGDPDKPMITGRVYNQDNMPPYDLPGSATQSGWKSNSSPGGGGFNELRFEDKAGAEEVYFQAQKDHTELIKNDENRTVQHDMNERVDNISTQSVGVDRHEDVGNNKTTSVGVDRTVEIGSNDTETVGANRSLNVGSDETISVGANSTEDIGINHTQNVGATQSISVKAARMDAVGGAETRTVGAAQSEAVGATRSVNVGISQNHEIGTNDAWSIGADQNVDIVSNQAISIGGGQTGSVGKDQSWQITGARASKIGKGDVTQVGEDMGVTVGKSLAIEAADQISLTCGSSAIVMKKDGTITIDGKDITLKGSGKINIDASGAVTIKGSTINQN